MPGGFGTNQRNFRAGVEQGWCGDQVELGYAAWECNLLWCFCRPGCGSIPGRRIVGPNEISCFKKGYSLEISTDFDAFFFLMKANEIWNFVEPNF